MKKDNLCNCEVKEYKRFKSALYNLIMHLLSAVLFAIIFIFVTKIINLSFDIDDKNKVTMLIFIVLFSLVHGLLSIKEKKNICVKCNKFIIQKTTRNEKIKLFLSSSLPVGIWLYFYIFYMVLKDV